MWGFLFCGKFVQILKLMAFLIILCLVLFSGCVYLLIPFIKHKTAIRRFHDFYMKTEEKPEIEEVYIDRLGNKWYTFKEIMKAPAKRTTDAEAMSRWAELCMTPEYFAIEMNKAIGFMNKQRIAQAAGIMNELLIRSTWAAERTTLQLLADVLFMIDGENPLCPTAEFMEKKKAIWAADPACEAFFLTAALNNIRSLERLSESDLMSYLKEKEIKEGLTKAARLQHTS